MMKKLPILIVIPHGGYCVPEELEGYQNVTPFDILFEADTCANELFSFDEYVAAKINTDVSRLFVDVDRDHLAVPPAFADGVIKRVTSQDKEVFTDDVFPDEIAISNLIQRYYVPFHETIDKIARTGAVRCVLICHTMKVVAPSAAADRGRPRPLVTVNSVVTRGDDIISTAPDDLARGLLDSFRKELGSENATVAERFSLNSPLFGSHIHKKLSRYDIPVLTVAVSRSLFFNEKYFSYEYLTVDELRIRQLRERLYNAVKRVF
ncbi:MAG TPA: N-formylglutamate amidohydrolase [Spirochaetota bacterium]|nr:N-formylglutamate amidohydrolase [Spirochaetota bacterium]